MLLAGILAALPAPRYWWLAVVGVFVGERAYAFAMLPETRPWTLVGIILNFAMVSWLPSAIGAFVVYLVHAWRVRRLRGGG